MILKLFCGRLLLCTVFVGIFAFSAITCNSVNMTQEEGHQPPMAALKDTVLTLHGVSRSDPWYWLRDRENPEVIAYLEAENAYLEKMMFPEKGLRDSLYEEMLSRVKQTDMTVPYALRGFTYYVRYEEGKEYPVYCRRAGSEGKEQVMLDVNKMAEGLSYCQVVGLSMSPNNRFLAYGVDVTGRRQYTLYVLDLETGKVLERDKVENTDGGYVWANDNATLYYDRKDSVTLRSDRIYLHRLGTMPESDPLVYHEQDETFSCSLFKTKDEKYIFIASLSTLTSEARYISSDLPGSEFKVIHPREHDMRYEVEHREGYFYIRTDDKASNFRLVRCPVGSPSKLNWEEVLPHNPDVLLEEIEVFKDYLVTMERKAGLVSIVVRPWGDVKLGSAVVFPEAVYGAGLYSNPSYDATGLRYQYTSMVTPSTIFELDFKTRETNVLKKQEVLGGYDAGAYVTKRLWATASDGTSIPISIVYRKDRAKGGPLLQYGYGSYGYTLDAYFSSVRLSLLDRGWAFAIAHVRGGQEMGRSWYEDGKLLKKKNTFTDFISVSEFLIKEGYTRSSSLYAMGGSAGGLLMGAVINMRPELYKGIVAQVPFVDVVTTMLDTDIPLTTGEFDEWGNPEQKSFFDYMLSYSPYDNVQAVSYPHMLVTTGLHDSQVQYWEPAKWVAKLRYTKKDDHLLLFHTEMEAGHGGKSGRFQRLYEMALEYAFLIKVQERLGK